MLLNTGPLELVSAGVEPTFREWVLCPRFDKGAWLGPTTVLAQEMGRSQEQHEEAHGTVWIVVQGRLLRCAAGHLRHLSEGESLSIDRHPILVPSYLQELNVANALVGAERNP